MLDDADVKNMCDTLERQRGINPKQAQNVVLGLLQKPGRKKALAKAQAILNAPVERAPPKPPPETKPNKKAKKPKVKPAAIKLATVMNLVTSDDETPESRAPEDEPTSSSSSEPDECDQNQIEAVQEKLSLLRYQLEQAKQNEDFEGCITLRDAIKATEQQLAAGSTNTGQHSQVATLRTQLGQRLVSLQQLLAQSQRDQPCQQESHEEKQRKFIERVQAEQATMLADLEEQSSVARAEVGAIPTVLARLQAMLSTTNDNTHLTEEHFEIQEASNQALAALKKCQHLSKPSGFNDIVNSARQWCQQ